MTLPPDPTQFLAHCKAHKTPTQSQPCKELKMPAAQPPTPADGILIGLTLIHQLITTFSRHCVFCQTDNSTTISRQTKMNCIFANKNDKKKKYERENSICNKPPFWTDVY